MNYTDYYGNFIHELARDIDADRRGFTILDDCGKVLCLPNTNDTGLEKYLLDLGVKFKKKFEHTYKIISYPENFEFTAEMADDMAKQLWGLEPGQKWHIPI